MTRIRYTEKNGLLVSQDLLIGEEMGQIRINPEKLEFNIYKNNIIVYNCSTSSLPRAKSQAKIIAKSLGLVIDDEIRNKGSTRKFEL